jgi:hypothetical protein
VAVDISINPTLAQFLAMVAMVALADLVALVALEDMADMVDMEDMDIKEVIFTSTLDTTKDFSGRISSNKSNVINSVKLYLNFITYVKFFNIKL